MKVLLLALLLISLLSRSGVHTLNGPFRPNPRIFLELARVALS